MSFCYSTALVKMKIENAAVRRAGWNGKGMWIKRVTNWGVELDIPSVVDATCAPFIVIKSADNYLVPWNPSQADMEATDWEEATEVAVTMSSIKADQNAAVNRHLLMVGKIPDGFELNTLSKPNTPRSLFLIKHGDPESFHVAETIRKSFHPDEKYDILAIDENNEAYYTRALEKFIDVPEVIDLYHVNIDPMVFVDWSGSFVFPKTNRLYFFYSPRLSLKDQVKFHTVLNDINSRSGYQKAKFYDGSGVGGFDLSGFTNSRSA